MKKTLILSVLLSMSLMAAETLNTEKVNANLSTFNKENGLEMKVIGSSPLGKDLYFVVVGDIKANKFMNIVVGREADIAIAPNQVVPLSPNVEWENQKTGLTAMLKSIEKMSMGPASKQLSKIYKGIDRKNILYFNGAEKSENYDVFIVDPKCPHCQEEISSINLGIAKTGKPFAIVPVAAFGEDSVDSVVYVVKNQKSDFESFAKVFKDAQEKTDVDAEAKANVLKTTADVFGSGLVKGVPFRFDYTSKIDSDNK
ncbi:MAG: hypothetical protein PHT07_10060 [Paludibacter sp.]|nr:hypothetical protein [Paludibacter sp.]